MARADLISVHCTRGLISYFHYGIDMGDETVVHLATMADGSEMSVQRVSLIDFACGETIVVEPVDEPLEPDEVIKRAEAAVGLRGYHLIEGNCEHFARYIKTGRSESVQVDMYVKSVVRTAFSGIAHTASKSVIASSLAALSRSRLLLTVGSLVPTLMGETVRCGSYMAARRLNLSHADAEKTSRHAGHAACALGGLVVGGPAGSIGALAISIAADRVTSELALRNEQH